MFLILLMYACFASVFAIAKYALNFVQPIFLIGFRMTLAGFLLLAYMYLFKRKKCGIKKEHIYLFIPIIFFHVYLAYITEFWALQYLTAAKTCLLYSLTPFVSAILSYFFFSEVVTLKKVIGLGLGLIGFLPTFMSSSGQEELVLAASYISWPEIMMIISVFSSVLGWIVFRRLIKYEGYSAIMINGVGMFFGGIMAFVTSAFLEYPYVDCLVSNWFELIKWAFLIILLANFVSYNLYGHLLKRYTATLLSFAGFLCPLMAAFFGWFFLSEKVSWDFMFTLGFVIVGLYVFYQEELKQGYIVKH